MNKDLTAGGAVIALGTIRQMGPGMFPLGLGLLMVVIGIAIALPALASVEAGPDLPLRGMVFCLGSVAAFALLIRPAGLFPATIATACLASFALPAPGWKGLIGLSMVLCLLTWGLFIVVLKVPVTIVHWPF